MLAPSAKRREVFGDSGEGGIKSVVGPVYLPQLYIHNSDPTLDVRMIRNDVRTGHCYEHLHAVIGQLFSLFFSGYVLLISDVLRYVTLRLSSPVFDVFGEA